MPYTYTRDDQRRRIVIALKGAFSAKEGLATVEQRRGEVGAVSYGVLYDLRGLIGQPTVGELKQFMDAEALPAAGEQPLQPRGPIAFLVTEPALYEKACTYRALGRGKLEIEVFRDYEEADSWLKMRALP
jgi:hypothetical protein